MPAPIDHHQRSRCAWWLSAGLLSLLAACAQPPQGPSTPPPLRDVTPSASPAPAPAPQAASPAPLPATPAPAVARTEQAATPPPASASPSAPAPSAPFDAGGTLSMEPGLYRCELNRRVVVRRIGADGQSMVINWLGKDATMRAVQARTGALRFEDPKAGLVWIVIVGKSMLLDSRAGRTLANDCKL